MRSRIRSWKTLLACLACAAALLPGTASPAGFALDFESARALGTATAGSASAADAATIFYNPAGLAFIAGTQVVAGGQLFLLHDRFTNDGSTILGGALPTPGGNGRDAIPTVFIPWVFAARALGPDLAVGIGLFAPFGLETHYGKQFVGRYQNDFSALTVLDLNPAVAWRPTPWLSIGAGLAVEYADVELRNAIDFGSLCAVRAPSEVCAALGLVPGLSDGQTQVKGRDWDLGYSVAAIAQSASGRTRLGISYRSRVDHHFGKANQTFDVPAGARAFLAAGPNPAALTGSGVTTELPLPARLTVGVRHLLDSGHELLLDATLTKWGVLQTTVIRPDNPLTGFAVEIPQGYEDAWRFALGVSTPAYGNWQFRGGFAHDETPIPPRLVQAALPDRNRRYFTLGASYRFARHWSADIGYAHVRYSGRIPIDRSTPNGDRLRGDFDVGGNIAALQLRFEP